MTIRVLLVDDQPLLRTGFRLILEAEPDITVVGQAGDGKDAQEQARALLPDVVLMDIRMPGVDGIEATRRIVREAAPTRTCRGAGADDVRPGRVHRGGAAGGR